MKTALRTSGQCQGSVLMVTLLSALLIGTVLASYLTLVRHQNATVARAQDWNAAMGAAEAGVEEALAQLTHVPLTTNINRAANGWVLDAGSYRVPSPRTVLHGSYNVRFTDVPQPVIYATGTIVNPALGSTIARTIEVKTTNAPVFNIGMAALLNIKMNGNNITTDSYISTDTNYSTGGRYDPAKRRKNGDVASVNGVVEVGNANIYGDLLTGPAGRYSIGKNGVLSGEYVNDFNAEYEDVKPPQNLASFFAPTAGMINQKLTNAVGGAAGTVTYAYAFLASGNIKLTGISGSTVYVGPNANVTLYVSGDVDMKDSIYIAPGAKLTLYMAGSSFTVGGIVNNGTAPYFSYMGLPNNTSIKFSGNGAFTGSIYAPQAVISLNGGGKPSDTTDFSGACVVKSVDMNGHFSFHYDEALAKWGPAIYKAMSWREL